MLTISPQAMGALRAAHWPAFAERMRETLLGLYPHFLPCFSIDAQRAIVANMLDRARAWGLARQDALFAYCKLMVEVAPNFDRAPAINAVLRAQASGADQFADLAASLPAEHIAQARAQSSNLGLFVHPAFDDAPELERLEQALRLALEGRPDAARARSAAHEAAAHAGTLGLQALPDGPLVVAVCRSFWGPDFHTLRWAAALPREGWSGPEILELLRLRLAMQFRRFV